MVRIIASAWRSNRIFCDELASPSLIQENPRFVPAIRSWQRGNLHGYDEGAGWNGSATRAGGCQFTVLSTYGDDDEADENLQYFASDLNLTIYEGDDVKFEMFNEVEIMGRSVKPYSGEYRMDISPFDLKVFRKSYVILKRNGDHGQSSRVGRVGQLESVLRVTIRRDGVILHDLEVCCMSLFTYHDERLVSGPVDGDDRSSRMTIIKGRMKVKRQEARAHYVRTADLVSSCVVVPRVDPNFRRPRSNPVDFMADIRDRTYHVIVLRRSPWK